jgi:hypothetical protein
MSNSIDWLIAYAKSLEAKSVEAYSSTELESIKKDLFQVLEYSGSKDEEEEEEAPEAQQFLKDFETHAFTGDELQRKFGDILVSRKLVKTINIVELYTKKGYHLKFKSEALPIPNSNPHGQAQAQVIEYNPYSNSYEQHIEGNILKWYFIKKRKASKELEEEEKDCSALNREAETKANKKSLPSRKKLKHSIIID